MSADKHPAEVTARSLELFEWTEAADMLRTIPALEAERDRLRAEVEALRKANSTFATAAILPDDKVIVDKAEIEALRDDCENARELARPVCEALNIPILHDAPRAIEALRADAERYRWLRSDSQTVTGPCAYGSWMGLPMFTDELDSAIDAARKQQ